VPDAVKTIMPIYRKQNVEEETLKEMCVACFYHDTLNPEKERCSEDSSISFDIVGNFSKTKMCVVLYKKQVLQCKRRLE
jgi:hypothetical protein